MATLTCPSTDINFLSPNGFSLSIERLPNVAFFCQDVELPGISLPPLAQANPLSRIQIPSDRMDFEPLNLTFTVDERMNNWIEVFNWIKGLGFPEEWQQYTQENNRGMPGLSELSRNYSDAELMILGSNNVPVRTIQFKDVFPVSLGGIKFSSTNNDVQYATANLTLEYSYYTIV